MSEPRPARPHRTGRRKARKAALDVLFAADLRGIDAMAILAQGLSTSQAAPGDFSARLVEAVTDHGEEIDRLIADHLKPGWTLARMPRVDRCLARLALADTLFEGTPLEVAVSEAVALAAELSTDESPRFLSGLLGAAARPDGADGMRQRDPEE